MIDYLMVRMRDHMSPETHARLMRSWEGATSDAAQMQNWVDRVRLCIGAENYERIKRGFREKQDREKERERSMHCTQDFSRKRPGVRVRFKQDLGADPELEGDAESFVREFEVVLHGV